MAVFQFHGVSFKKLWGLNPQIQNSIRSGPPKSSKTNFEEFHYVEFWRFEAIYDFQSEPLLLLMTGLSKLTKVGGIWTISWYMKALMGKKSLIFDVILHWKLIKFGKIRGLPYIWTLYILSWDFIPLHDIFLPKAIFSGSMGHQHTHYNAFKHVKNYHLSHPYLIFPSFI